mmetsp:Transcript_24627/g.30700  ORF Transcript_24627/g.30700 Transcript_24627/m.30700 type:complete len:85 (-) Transcript_24627:498-752(-)
MRRALMTALIACSKRPRVQGRVRPIKITLMPDLRENVTYKNTVASSVNEIKAFIVEVMREAHIEEGTFEFDYSLIGEDNLWYLR